MKKRKKTDLVTSLARQQESIFDIDSNLPVVTVKCDDAKVYVKGESKHFKLNCDLTFLLCHEINFIKERKSMAQIANKSALLFLFLHFFRQHHHLHQ